MNDNIRECLEDILALDGALAAALVEWPKASVVDVVVKYEGDERTGAAALGDAEVVLAKIAAMGDAAQDELIEDVIITLGNQYHVMRLLKSAPRFFLHAALDRSRANLAQASMKLVEIEDLLVLEVGAYRPIKRTGDLRLDDLR